MRKEIERTRNESTKEWRRNALRVAAARKGSLLIFHAAWKCEYELAHNPAIDSDYLWLCAA